MTVYLGTLGRMIPIYSTPSAQLETEERYSFSTTLEGRRKAQARLIGRRTWSLNAQFADPAEHSLLSQFADGAWGNGPFIFVPVEAPLTNLLTPGASNCRLSDLVPANSSVALSPGGPMRTGDSWLASSVIKTTNSGVFFGTSRLPFLPGRAVTGSAWVAGAGGEVRLEFRDADNQGVLIVRSAPATDELARLSVSAVPPVGAVSVWLSASASIVRAAQPAVTWTDSLLPWSIGHGCERAVVHGVSSDVRLAVPGATYSNIAFSVSEVG